VTNVTPQRSKAISSMVTIYPTLLTKRATHILNLFYQSRGRGFEDTCLTSIASRQSPDFLLDIRFAQIRLQSLAEIPILDPRLRSMRRILLIPSVPIRVLSLRIHLRHRRLARQRRPLFIHKRRTNRGFEPPTTETGTKRRRKRPKTRERGSKMRKRVRANKIRRKP
jgi:hypothetical protein